MPIYFLIIVTLAYAAATFVVVASIILVIHKAVNTRTLRKREKLYQYYSGVFAENLLEDLPVLRTSSKPSDKFKQFDSLIEPVKDKLNEMSWRGKKNHRAALKKVLIDFAQDVSGEASERLVYFFHSLGFVDDELKLMQSRHWWIRAQAARDLGLLRARKAITALTAALEDENHDVRLQAMQSLVALVGVAALEAIFRISRNLSQWTKIELSIIIMKSKEEGVPYLMDALRSPDKSVVVFAIEMLAEIGFVSAVEPLIIIFQQTMDPLIQLKATEALGRLGDERAEHVLMQAAQHPLPHVRIKALEALGRLGSSTAIPLLMSRTQVSDFIETITATRALGALGQEGHKQLKTLTKSNDKNIRAIAAQVMEEITEISDVGK